MSDLMVLDLGGLPLPFDPTQAAELTKGMTAGLSGGFQRSARLSMANSGDWELITAEGEVIDVGREPNIVIVDQREFVSRIHYAKSFDEQKASGEFSPPDCQSYDGVTPDASVENPYSKSCKDCDVVARTGLNCGYYRRVVAVLIDKDGTFSEPFVFEPKAKSLFDDTVVGQRYGSFRWYMNVLASQKRNGVPMPVPTQSVVTRCMAMPKAEVATIKFGIADTPAGGFWTLNKEQFDKILDLKDSDQVKDMLKPFDVAFNNPSSAGRIPIKDVTDEPLTGGVESKPTHFSAGTAVATTAEAPKKKAPARKVPTKKAEPPVAEVAKEKVVLGMDHPDVVNTTDFDYGELKEWASEATQEEINEFLAENFPQALEPVEVEAPKKKAPTRKVPTKKAKEPVEELSLIHI